ncbi:MAG: proteophosphoglycan precursor [Rhodospirillales bacterium]|nr:proteophosphoglycan precursor [Rhodospirillales bacterium]
MDKISAPGGLPFPLGEDRPDEAYDMRIARDGTWFYHGSPIGRIALVKLFATVLRRDDAGDFWLITPAERGRITVDDVPFVAVEVRAEGEGHDQSLSFRTNLDEWVTADGDHPIRVTHGSTPGGELSDTPAPYILIRDRLEARIGRAVFYELVGLAEERRTPQGIELGVWSEQIFFPLGRIPPDPALLA